LVSATLLDMQWIAGDAFFAGRVRASMMTFCINQVTNNTSIKNFCATVLNNPNQFINQILLGASANQTLADSVVAAAGANFTTSTLPSAVQAAVTTSTPLTTGATDTEINNAVAQVITAMANV